MTAMMIAGVSTLSSGGVLPRVTEAFRRSHGSIGTLNDAAEEKVDPTDPVQRGRYLKQAETRLELLDRKIGDNDWWQRRIERLQERHRELSEEEDDPTYLRGIRKFEVDLRQLEKEVYGE